MIRPVVSSDLPALEALIEANGLFPSELLTGMLSAYFGGASDELWMTDDDHGPVSVAYAAPERMTSGTWNLYLIAVHPERQGEGRGRNLLQTMERVLADRGERMLLVETSALPEFERTRTFYLKNGYEQEARIRDFYQAGEDKIIFRKALKKSDVVS